MKKVLVLGSTGSIGCSTINLIKSHSEKFKLCGIQARNSKENAQKISQEFSCPLLICDGYDEKKISEFIEKTSPDIVVNGISGAAGLLPSKIVLEKSIPLALANKETIVMAGSLIKKLSEEKKAPLLPVDSEHSAIFCLYNKIGKENVSKIIITASGGPFRKLSKDELENVTVEQALNHPTWKMGKKITIDSATLANKGLEVIEAANLFDARSDEIQVVIHPESLIHSLVKTKDGMLYAQISNPDMKHPIFTALTWPETLDSKLENFDLFDCKMTFFKPDTTSFPMLQYAFECVNNGGSYSVAFNASNEIAVQAFIDGKIKFTEISKIVRNVLQNDWSFECLDFNEIFEVDKKAREITRNLI